MNKKVKLSDEGIRESVDWTSIQIERAGVDDRKKTAILLTLEEIFLIYRDRFGAEASDTPVMLEYRRSHRGVELDVYIDSPQFDPISEDTQTLRRLLESLDDMPKWNYEKGQNHLRFRCILLHTTGKSLFFSWKYIRNHRKLLYAAVGSQILSGVFSFIAPILGASIIRDFVDSEGERVLYIALLLTAVKLLKNLFTVIGSMTYNKVYAKTLAALDEDLAWNTLRVNNQCMEEKGSGLFVQRLTSDTERIAYGFNDMADMFTQIINYIGVLIALLVVSPLMCAAVVVLIILQALIELLRMKRLNADDRVYRNSRERFSGLIGEMVRGQKDVKLLNSEQQFSDDLKGRIEDMTGKRLYLQKRTWGLKFFRMELGEVGTYVIICLLAFLISKSVLLPSTALVVYNYYNDLGPHVIRFVSSCLDFLSDFNLSNERVAALLHNDEFPKEVFGKTELKDMKGEIRFDHVYFGYRPGKPGEKRRMILKDMSLCIRPGENVALVGRSGCGKTTLFNLIVKLYEAQGGEVKLDGININELTKESIRSNITIVSQNPYIFHMSVKDNLRLTKPEATDRELEEICRLACIDEDIRKMPQGYDTILGEGGVNISGGQRQRMAIARAMLRESSIVLFDEATSALDNVTQANIQKAINNMKKDRTVFIIAHRLSTIYDADRILYMQDGRILAEGTHEELLKSCEPYRILASMEGNNPDAEHKDYLV